MIGLLKDRFAAVFLFVSEHHKPDKRFGACMGSRLFKA